MSRTFLSTLAVSVSALAILLGGCGGGGGGGTNGGNGDGGGTVQGQPTVRFFGATGNSAIGQASFTANGAFPTPPANAVRFSIDVSNVLDTDGTKLYHDIYFFNGSTYDNGIGGCYPSLPTPGSGNGVLDELQIYVRKTSPPPPPPSCGL